MSHTDAYNRPDPEQLAARLDRIEAEYRYRISALGDDPHAADIERAQADLRRTIATDTWSEWLLPLADLRYWQSEVDRLRRYLANAPDLRPVMLAHGVPAAQIDYGMEAATADLRQAEAFVRRLTPKPGDLTVQMIGDGYCAYISKYGEKPSQLDLAEAMGTSDSSIKRYVKKGGRRWPVRCGRGTCPIHPPEG